MSLKLFFLALILLLLSGVVHAEDNCPEGYYPIGGGSPGAPQGCAPIPGFDQGQQQVKPPQPHWINLSGGVATDAKKGVLGTAINMASQAAAGEAALADCKAKGGTECQIDSTYTNGCVAMSAGDTAYKAKSGPTMDAAVKAATEICNAATSGCHIYYSACSLPRQAP
jgi:hypothetical protein